MFFLAPFSIQLPNFLLVHALTNTMSTFLGAGFFLATYRDGGIGLGDQVSMEDDGYQTHYTCEPGPSGMGAV